jgi:carboxypeptidase C (cathepsin A)
MPSSKPFLIRSASAIAALVLAGAVLPPQVQAQTQAPAAPADPAGQATAPAAPASPIPFSRVTAPGPVEPLPAPKRFVTKHSVMLGKTPLNYTAIAGETYLYNRAAEPIGSIFSFSYLKDGPVDPQRPVLFVFNGGPGSASFWLHMGVVGPRRVHLDQEINPSNTPPFGVVDNPDTLLDVADIVFIDPGGTGWSRVVGKGVPADFWGVDEDADSIAQFIELWLTEHQRWNAPKYVMGESYGSTRAALLPRALLGSPFYVGLMRGITLNGVILLGTTLDPMNVPPDPAKALSRQALHLPAQADTAWYHQRIDRRGLGLEQFHQEVLAFAKGPYLQALRREADKTLGADERAAVVARLMAYTGLPAQAFAASLALKDSDFANGLLAAQGLQVGAYDSRYTLPLEGSGGDPVADDPSMTRYSPGFVAAFHQMASAELKIKMDRPYGFIVWKDLYPSWNFKRSGAAPNQTFATDLAIAMRRTPKMRVLVASGYYDLVTHSATAEASVEEAKLPADRLMLRRYGSGHMLYLGDTARPFADDVRALIATSR